MYQEGCVALTGQTREAIRNLALLSVCDVALSEWTLYYLDWFPVIGGLLGLGGLFAWLAFLANLISDRRGSSVRSSRSQALAPFCI